MISSSAKVVAILRSILLTVTALVMICTALPSCAPQTAETDHTVNLYYLQNDTRKNELNEAGVDYTPAYIPAILAWLGASGTPCTPDQVSALGEKDILLANRDDLQTIPEHVGKVILLGGGEVSRAPEIVSHLLFGEERIPLFAPISEIADAQEILYMGEDAEGQPVPAVVRQDERTYTFRFDLCATVWFSGDGFSDGKGKNGFAVGRTPDTRPVPDCMYSDQPYNDHLLTILEDMLLSMGVPLVARLPLTEDGVYPDFALHISGDDDYTSATYNLNAAKVMHELGLPYHVNAMPNGTNFIITRKQMEEMAALGCELGLHTNFLEVPYNANGQRISVDRFERYFGLELVTNVNHCFVQKNMVAEKLRWLAESGVLADGSKCGEIDHSNINAFNLCGFGFGTSFPRYTCDDAEHANHMISCMEIPITYYEPRYGGKYTDAAMIMNYIDGAVEEGRIIQFFIHPHYFYPDKQDTEWAMSALRMAMAYWDVNDYTVCLTTIDNVARFWQMRKDTCIVSDKDGYTVQSDSPLAIALPDGVTSVTVDGVEAPINTRTVTGRERNYVVIPTSGEHRITVNE